MKEETLEQLAKKLNISKSTVCKAARHCSGVDSHTRQLILDALPRDGKPEKYRPIYTILPDVPQYFWKNLQKGFMAGENQKIAPVKHNVYTRCSDEATILRYLEEAEEMGPDVLVIAAYVTPEIRKRLIRMADRCMILLVSEYYDVPRTFFIGADGYRDGRILGEEYVRRFSDRRLIHFTVRENENAILRSKGFFDVVAEKAPESAACAVEVDIDNDFFRDLKMMASRLAFLLSDRIDGSNRDWCIYAPVGMPNFINALKKTRYEDRAVCLGHDYFTEDQVISDGFCACCNQDVFAQGFAAAKEALRFLETRVYPERKWRYVASKLETRG